MARLACLTTVVTVLVSTVYADDAPLLDTFRKPTHPVECIMRIENAVQYQDYVLYVAAGGETKPRRDLKPVRATEAGEASITSFDGRDVYYLFLYAIPRSFHSSADAAWNEAWFNGEAPEVLWGGPIACPPLDGFYPQGTRITIACQITHEAMLHSTPRTRLRVTRMEQKIERTESAALQREPWIIGGIAGGLALTSLVWLTARKKT